MHLEEISVLKVVLRDGSKREGMVFDVGFY